MMDVALTPDGSLFMLIYTFSDLPHLFRWFTAS